MRRYYPNAWHHVMNRARRGQDLFADKSDYQQFIDLLQEITDLFFINKKDNEIAVSRTGGFSYC